MLLIWAPMPRRRCIDRFALLDMEDALALRATVVWPLGPVDDQVGLAVGANDLLVVGG